VTIEELLPGFWREQLVVSNEGSFCHTSSVGMKFSKFQLVKIDFD
jgi:hypothetical protein